GRNVLEVSAVLPGPTPTHEWTAEYLGKTKPAPPWRADPPRPNTLCEVREGALFIADRGDQSGDYFYYAYPWNTDPAAESVVEARVRVVSGWNNIILCNGVHYERVGLYPDHIDLYEAKRQYAMDTTDDYHTYRVVIQNNDILVYVDGVLRLDGRGTFKTPGPAGRNDVRFGAANSPGKGEAYWQSVRIRAASTFATLYDVALTIQPRASGTEAPRAAR
ncbi:MAG: hypothetical protein QHJ73_12070, partial [Armatimonadota bacterium]|nr:hypothetical protein [Armatimonadota bacterium]